MTMPSKVRAELLPAFLWVCPSCGEDNFERTIVAEMSELEMEELREDHGVEVWEEGMFLRSPNSVTCRHCQEEFATLDYQNEVTEE